MSEYRLMSTATLLRLIGSREYRRKVDAESRFYAVAYTDEKDESIVDDVAGELADRIDEGRRAAHRVDE